MMGAALYHRALMLPHQGRPQTPGHRRGPIPAMCQYQGSPVSDAGRAHPRPWLRVHEDAGPSSRPDTGSVSSL